MHEEIVDTFEKAQKRLVVQTADFSLRTVADMVSDEVIDLSPVYQRRERWKQDRKSALIESFLLNIPVPPIYLAEEDYGAYTIIDGKQRITAISEFLTDKYRLRSLERFHSLEGMKFSDLPSTLRNSLLIRPYLRVITLLRQSAPELKYEVFLRLNRGGIKLNNQEVRNVAFRGELNDLIYNLATDNFLRGQMGITSERSPSFQKMEDAEAVLRFLTLRNSWESFSGDLARSMDYYMLENEMTEHDLVEVHNDFTTAIERCEILWGEKAFRRFDGNAWRNQFLVGMYDSQMIAAHEISSQTFINARNSASKISSLTKELLKDEDYEEAVRRGTNTPSRVRTRITKTINMLEEVAV